MRWLFWVMTLYTLNLFAVSLDVNDTKKVEVLKDFDIPESFLNDPYLQDMYDERKRYCLMNGFANSIDNADVFIPMLSSLLAQSDLPPEFLFIVLAESGLDTMSTSSRGAGGLWQLMPRTGRTHGLIIDQYVDERRDHVKSTRAAINYLSQLHRKFGKWYLAIIAYNCGESKLSSAMRKAGSDDLSILANPNQQYLSGETKKYVRRVVALALLASEKVFLEQIQYDHLIGVASQNPITTLYLPEGEDINDIATVLEMPKKNLTMLNTHLRSGVTPPNQNFYPVYIPESKLDLFEEKYQPRGVQKYFVMRKIKLGETFSSLTKRYKTDRSAILDENMMGDHDELKVNRILKIPISSSFIKAKLFLNDKIPTSAPKVYNFEMDQFRIKNPFNPVKTDEKRGK
jgi:membrane-bound lytic murein transglycosylase D